MDGEDEVVVGLGVRSIDGRTGDLAGLGRFEGM